MKQQCVVIFGSGASFDSGFKVKPSDMSSIIDPPMDLSFFDSIPSEWIMTNYPALAKFKQLYFDIKDKPGMEEVWTAVSLNHKHIRLATYKWMKETRNYVLSQTTEYANSDLLSVLQYTSESGGGYLHSPLYTEYKFLGDCDRDFRRLVFDVFSNYIEPQTVNNYKVFDSLLKDSSKCTLMGYISFDYDCFLVLQRRL